MGIFSSPRRGRRHSYSGRAAVCNRARALAGAVAAVLLMVLFAAGAGAGRHEIRILALGDSLTAGYGLTASAAFPARLEAKLRAMGHAVRVFNGGVSGDTTAGGRARLDWVLNDRPRFAIVELGANDGLRGLDPAMTRANLDAIITRLKAARIAVLLTGMVAPPNMGREYEARFNAVFPALARKHDVAFYPFFLAGVALRPELKQHDGMHPNADGVTEIVDRITPYVVRLLKMPQ